MQQSVRNGQSRSTLEQDGGPEAVDVAVGHGGAHVEELAFGPERAERTGPPRRWPAAVLVLLVLIGSGVAVLDSRLRDSELATLLAAVERSHATAKHADVRLSAIVSYASPALVYTTTPGEVRDYLGGLVEDMAREGAASVHLARQRVLATDVLPWHFELGRARMAYLDYLDAKGAYLELVSTDARTYFDSDGRAGQLLVEAREALRAAAGIDGARRVDEILGP